MSNIQDDKMPNVNIFIQRLGVIAASILASVLLGSWSSSFGPNVQLHSFWGMVLALVGWFVLYGFLARPAASFTMSIPPVGKWLVVRAIAFNVVFSTAVFTASYEIASLIAPTLLTVASLPGLIINLLSMFVMLFGVLFAISFKPKSDGK